MNGKIEHILELKKCLELLKSKKEKTEKDLKKIENIEKTINYLELPKLPREGRQRYLMRLKITLNYLLEFGGSIERIEMLKKIIEGIEQKSNEIKLKKKMQMEEWKLKAFICKYFYIFQELYYREGHKDIISLGYFSQDFITKMQNKGVPLDVIRGMEDKMQKKYKVFTHLKKNDFQASSSFTLNLAVFMRLLKPFEKYIETNQ